MDSIFKSAALAANRLRIPLAKMAVEETGMGIVEDKIIKNHYAAEYIYNTYKDTKTCGVVEEDNAAGIMKVAEPIGVIGAVIPTTNPTSTAIFKCLLALKTRNGIIISPHPRAKNCTMAAAKAVLDAAVAAGAPADIISWIEAPSLPKTNLLMKEADIILATGGPGMVKAAYSSGTPALGVGAGNAAAILDPSCDLVNAVNSIIHSKTFDNGMICATEQTVIADELIYDDVKDEFKRRGCYFLNKEEADKIRATMLINGALNAKIVGQRPVAIAKMAGFEVPESTKVLIGEATSTDSSEAFGHEKLTTILGMYKSRDFDNALDIAEALLVNNGGLGHTSSLWIDEIGEREKLAKFADRMKACRLLVNTPSSLGGIGDILPPPRQHSVEPRRNRRHLQLQLPAVADARLRQLGRQFRVRERRRQTSFEHQDRGNEKRKHVVVPCAREGVPEEGMPRGRAPRARRGARQEEGVHRHRLVPLRERVHQGD